MTLSCILFICAYILALNITFVVLASPSIVNGALASCGMLYYKTLYLLCFLVAGVTKRRNRSDLGFIGVTANTTYLIFHSVCSTTCVYNLVNPFVISFDHYVLLCDLILTLSITVELLAKSTLVVLLQAVRNGAITGRALNSLNSLNLNYVMEALLFNNNYASCITALVSALVSSFTGRILCGFLSHSGMLRPIMFGRSILRVFSAATRADLSAAYSRAGSIYPIMAKSLDLFAAGNLLATIFTSNTGGITNLSASRSYSSYFLGVNVIVGVFCFNVIDKICTTFKTLVSGVANFRASRSNNVAHLLVIALAHCALSMRAVFLEVRAFFGLCKYAEGDRSDHHHTCKQNRQNSFFHVSFLPS